MNNFESVIFLHFLSIQKKYKEPTAQVKLSSFQEN